MGIDQTAPLMDDFSVDSAITPGVTRAVLRAWVRDHRMRPRRTALLSVLKGWVQANTDDEVETGEEIMLAPRTDSVQDFVTDFDSWFDSGGGLSAVRSSSAYQLVRGPPLGLIELSKSQFPKFPVITATSSKRLGYMKSSASSSVTVSGLLPQTSENISNPGSIILAAGQRNGSWKPR
ncbi:hypothetical protein JCGZ_05987 [Jatropha curcas]|uniref:Uncharacterized protein n=1 Tax=Jatropha curcas TaxID=180498 RepID=A0A067KRA5_JATCU|nr:hypothetical protein JCGZ_05987 [Jatropha curcas]